MTNKSPKLSIVVSTYSLKRYPDIISLLEAIGDQTLMDLELIIVVDENEDLYNRLIDYKKNNAFYNLNIVYNLHNKGLSHSRNIGIENSKSDIVAFLDDDAIPEAGWAKAIVDDFDECDVGSVTGEIIPLWEHQKMSWFPKILYWMISCSYTNTPDCKEETERGFGTCMAFRKELLTKFGGFDTRLGINRNKWIGGEDTAMFLKIKSAKKRIIFDPNVKIKHKIYLHRINYSNILKRAFNGGMSIAAMKKINKYKIANSTEMNYLKVSVYRFYVESFKRLIKTLSMSVIWQIVVVSSVIIMEAIGYIYGSYKLSYDIQ